MNDGQNRPLENREVQGGDIEEKDVFIALDGKTQDYSIVDVIHHPTSKT